MVRICHGLGGIADPWDVKFLEDVYAYQLSSSPLSTSQGQVVLKLLDKHRLALISSGCSQGAIDALLARPSYRVTPVVTASRPRQVRWAGGNLLVFRFKFNATLVTQIKNIGRSKASKSWYTGKETSLWVVPVVGDNLGEVMALIKRFSFEFDDDVVNFLHSASNVEGQVSEARVTTDILVTAKNDEYLGGWLSLMGRVDF